MDRVPQTQARWGQGRKHSAQWASLLVRPRESAKTPTDFSYASFWLFLQQVRSKNETHHDKITRQGKKPLDPEVPTCPYQSPNTRRLGSPQAAVSGLGVWQEGNRATSVPGGSCLACRMPACSVARSSVPGDASQRHVSESLRLCQPSLSLAHLPALRAAPLAGAGP